MVFLMDACSLAAEGSTQLFQASRLLRGMRRDEKLAVLVRVLFWLCF